MFAPIDFEKLPRFKPHAMKIFPLIEEWAAAYDVPREAIIRQLSWAHGWCLSNPKRAPKKDIVRFLFNWMRLAKKMGNLVTEKVVAPRPQDEEPDMSFEEMVEIRKQNMGGR